MESFKVIALIIFGFVFGFGFWYLIFWFITSEPNLFVWHWATKMVYLILGFSATTGSINALLKEY